MEMNGRKTEISIMNFFMCLLVVLIHCMGSAMWQTESTTVAYGVFLSLFKLSSFAVQAFIFLSAVKLFMKSGELNYKSFLLRRVTTVFVPYVIWVIIYYCVKLQINGGQFDAPYLIRSIFVGDMHAHFYFVILIMQFYILMPLWKWLFNREGAIVALPLTVVIAVAFQSSFFAISKSIFHFDFVYTDRTFVTYLGYWCLGAYAGMFYDKFCAAVKRLSVVICTLFVLFGFLCVTAYYKTTVFSEYIYGQTELYNAYTFIAIIFSFFISVCLRKASFFSGKFFGVLNKASFRVYLIHPLLLILFDSICPLIKLENPALLAVLRYIFVTVLSFGAACGIEFVIGKLKSIKKSSV